MKKTFPNRNGTSSVEFALVFPVILTFFIGMIGLTQVFLLNDTAQHAAYEGARSGLVITNSKDDVEDAVASFARSMGVRNTLVNVTPDTLDSSTREVSVTVSIPMRDNAWISAPFLPKDWAVNANITLAREAE